MFLRCRIASLLLFGVTLVLQPALCADVHVFTEMKTALKGHPFTHRTGAIGTKELIEPFASGCAVFDYDGDGDLDLYFLNGAEIPSLAKTSPQYYNRLYRNDGNFQFVDVTAEAGLESSGYCFGAAVGDYDNDGDLDIYVTKFGENQLFENLANGKFQDVTEKAGVRAGKWSTSAAFFDYNKDGLLDLYVCRYLEWELEKGPFCGNETAGWRSYCLPDPFPPIPDLLYRNNGDGTFTDVSDEAGVGSIKAKGLGVTVGDFNRDGWTDVFVANDRHKDFLFENRGDGTFEEMGSIYGVSYSMDGTRRAGMGADFGDFNQDGWEDLIVSNFADEGIAVFQSYEGKFFEDQAGLVGVLESSFPYVIFGLKFFDYDNDGLLDILGVTGHILDDIERYRPDRSHDGPTLLFRNNGKSFDSISDAPGGALSHRTVSRGAAFGDLDNDGDIDVIINNSDDAPSILRNDVGQRQESLLLQLEGRKSNRNAIGTRVEIQVSGQTQVLELKSAASYLSANDFRVHVGLGPKHSADKILLFWPSGTTQILENLESGHIYRIVEGQGVRESVPFTRQDSK